MRINVDGVGDVPEPCGDTLIQNYTVGPEDYLQGEGACDEIFHLGLRNPWRFSFDPKTHAMYIGDVGQDAFEEVNVALGQNHFGWSCSEGHTDGPTGTDSCIAPFSSPRHIYQHVGGNCAITGGYVYRGSAASLQGLYVYGDWCSGAIWFAHTYLDSTFVWWDNQWDNPNVDTSNLSSFGQDEHCELYVVLYGDGEYSGALYRFDDSERLSTSGFESYDCR